MRTLITLAAVLVALFLAACGGDDAPETTPTAQTEPGTPPSSTTPAATPSVPQSSRPIRWLAADPALDLGGATELARPADGLFPGMPPGPDGPQSYTWGLYVVQGNGALENVYSSGRLLTDLIWKDNRQVSLSFRTARNVQAPVVRQTVALSWEGDWSIYLDTKAVSQSFDPLPLDYWFDRGAPGSGQPFITTQSSPAGDKVLVTVRSLRPPPAAPPLPPFQTDAIYIVETSGQTKRLDGLGDLQSIAWFPNGRALYAMGNGSVDMERDLYFIPLQDGAATHIAGVLGLAVEGASSFPLDLKASRALFLVPDARGVEADVGVFDTNTGRTRFVGRVPSAYALTWPAGASKVLVGGVIVDPDTGASQPGSYTDIVTPPPTNRDVASPGGRYAATLADPEIPAATGRCAGVPYKLTVKEQQTGATKTLLECSSGSSGYLFWISPTKLITGIAPCWACEASQHTIWLVDVERETAAALTDGFEDGAFASGTPDGTRLLIGGSRLRVVSAEGVLERDFGPAPAGYVYDSAAWSPDGASFAFILRPAGWPIGP
jgi:hypothetical protein